MKLDVQSYRLTEKGNFGNIALIIGIIGLVFSFIGWYTNSEQFYFSYLTAFVFWVTIALGGLFFVLLHHLVDAQWSVVIRRFGESMMMVIPYMIILFIPLLFGLKELFLWMNPETVAADELLHGKSGYLNLNFFIIRLVVYFIIWTVLAYLLNKLSLKQNEAPSHDITKKMRIVSAPGMILFAVTLTFASFDWLMSLDAHWYSTIFGVYIFSGAFLSLVCMITLIIIRLQKNGVLQSEITQEHYHDLGKLMFAFTIFWGYMAFSQYFLIWYGNIPEETIWFLHRWESSWKTITYLIVYGHFVIPFFILFPQVTKKNKTVMTIMSLWILLMHWVDIYWIVMPTLHPHGFHFSWIDATTVIGIGGLVLYLFWRHFTSHPLIPVGDPKLEKSFKTVS